MKKLSFYILSLVMLAGIASAMDIGRIYYDEQGVFIINIASDSSLKDAAVSVLAPDIPERITSKEFDMSANTKTARKIVTEFDAEYDYLPVKVTLREGNKKTYKWVFINP